MAAAHGFQVMWLGFMAASDTYEMGIPKVPLARLYGNALQNFTGHERTTIEAFDPERGVLAGGEWHQARTYISALPSDRVAKLVPQLPIDFAAFEASSITGVHLWFDRPVTTMPHGTLLDRHIQWFYNKGEGRYLMLVISASDALLKMQRQEIIDLALRELTEFLPAVATAQLTKAHVVKEPKATFRAKPGLEAKRPTSRTEIPNLFLAGDWTRSGWPATMEGAVRSGYLAAEAASEALGKPSRFLIPDLA
jgi:zeta-carotene desaturase